MSKKVRFPLEMEDGVEVRSLEELKNNFSLSRVLGYVDDGRLVTWLQDRYENTIADAIASIDASEDDVAKRICEIFDVVYDENAKKEIDRAEERKRKMELLKKHQVSMEYAKMIDFVAFDQDDLYDLLDEDAKEIYLCGSKFSIPIDKSNTKYIGIIDGVEVVIYSKQIVDFDAKSIIFDNCKFDEKYEQLLKKQEKDAIENTVDKSNNTEFFKIRKMLSTSKEFATMSNEDKLKAIMDDATYQAKMLANGFASKPIKEDKKQLHSELVFKLSDTSLSKEETFDILNKLFDLYEGTDIPPYRLVASAKRAFASRRYDLTEFVNDRFLDGKAKI